MHVCVYNQIESLIVKYLVFSIVQHNVSTSFNEEIKALQKERKVNNDTELAFISQMILIKPSPIMLKSYVVSSELDRNCPTHCTHTATKRVAGWQMNSTHQYKPQQL